MAATFDLFSKPPRPAPRKMMHVVDAGSGLVKFKCHRCGYVSDWLPAGKVSDDKRGRPCPQCNRTEPQ